LALNRSTTADLFNGCSGARPTAFRRFLRNGRGWHQTWSAVELGSDLQRYDRGKENPNATEEEPEIIKSAKEGRKNSSDQAARDSEGWRQQLGYVLIAGFDSLKRFAVGAASSPLLNMATTLACH